MTDRPPLTNRRGFIVATGSAILGLYGLWAAYGAAPLPWSGGAGGHDGHDGHDQPSAGEHDHGAPAPAETGHGGHGGHGGSTGPSMESFRAEAEAFAERYRQPDGSVAPGVAPIAGPPGHDHGHDHGETPAAGGMGDDPVDVYLAAFQWGFEPAVLRLRRGVAYRFKMMAVDVGHGASIHLGPASRIIRLRPGALVEQQLTFTRTGSYLVYCTVYCGPGHDRMQGRIVVA